MIMKFKIDENLPVEVADALRLAGYDASTVFDQNMAGTADRNIASVVQREQRALLTLDLDFADIRNYPPQQFSGLIVIRAKRQDKTSVLAIVERVIKALERETLNRKLWIVDEQRIRIRE